MLPEERERAQPFSVDLVAWVDLEGAQQSDDLADTVDYGALAQTAADIVGGRSYRLLEALAGRLAERAAHRRPPPGGGGGRGAQAAAAAGARRRLDRGEGAARPLMAEPSRSPAGDGRPRPPPVRRAFIGLGSNLGDRRALLRAAVERMRRAGDVVGVSPLYETEPVGGPEGQGPYLNVVVELSTADTPRRLLERCQALEEAAGRVRTVRWGPRTLDADVLWVEGARWTRTTSPSPTRACGSGGSSCSPLADLAPDLVTSEQLEAVWWGRRPCG